MKVIDYFQRRPICSGDSKSRVDWVRCIPFLLMHVACLAVFWVGWSGAAVAIGLATLFLRVFGLTGFYHRYFSHRAFKTSRWFQFVGAVLGASAVQRGPLWWAAHHRSHHRNSDTAADPHSPVHRGFFWSHMAWFMTKEHYVTQERLVRDWSKYPELRFLNRYDFAVPVAFAVALFACGYLLETLAPGLKTSAWQVLVWGFFVSTVALYHLTFSINSVAHRWGTRPYPTGDDSRNNALLAMLTFGEGWHNNHHHYPASARQGFHWWQVDVTFYILVVLSWFGLVWNLKAVPLHVRDGRTRQDQQGADRSLHRPAGYEAIIPAAAALTTTGASAKGASATNVSTIEPPPARRGQSSGRQP